MKRSGFLKRYTPLPKPTSRMRSENPEKKARRRKKYAAHLRSPYFRALRKERLVLDDYRCVDCGGDEYLECDHESYARFGAELIEDVRTRCRYCHRRRHALQGKRISA